MKYADTNILMRLMTNDVLELSQRAREMVEANGKAEIVVLDSVLTELFFILEKNALYKIDRQRIVGLFMDIILPTPQFAFRPKSLEAFELFAKNPKLDFTDCLLLAHAGRQSTKLLSFDKDLLKVAA